MRPSRTQERAPAGSQFRLVVARTTNHPHFVQHPGTFSSCWAKTTPVGPQFRHHCWLDNFIAGSVIITIKRNLRATWVQPGTLCLQGDTTIGNATGWQLDQAGISFNTLQAFWVAWFILTIHGHSQFCVNVKTDFKTLLSTFTLDTMLNFLYCCFHL